MAWLGDSGVKLGRGKKNMGLWLFQAKTSVPSGIREMDICSFAKSFLINDLLRFLLRGCEFLPFPQMRKLWPKVWITCPHSHSRSGWDGGHWLSNSYHMLFMTNPSFTSSLWVVNNIFIETIIFCLTFKYFCSDFIIRPSKTIVSVI